MHTRTELLGKCMVDTGVVVSHGVTDKQGAKLGVIHLVMG